MRAFRKQAAIARLLTYVEHAIPTARIGNEPADPVLWLPAPQGYAVWIGARAGGYVAFISRRTQPQHIWHQYVGSWNEEPARLWPKVAGWLNAHDELNQAWEHTRQAATPTPHPGGETGRVTAMRIQAQNTGLGVAAPSRPISGRQPSQMPTIVPPAQPGLGGSSERNDQPTRLPSTSRTRTIRLIGYALIAAGLLFSLIPSEYSDQNLWAYEDWQDGQDVWAPFSGGAIALNTWPFVALVIFGLAGLVCLVWAAQDDRTTL